MIGRVLALLLLGYLLGYAMFVIALPPAAEAGARSEAVVVLTGAGGRIERGLAILRAKRAEKMFVSGVARGVTPADLAAENDASEEIFECCVELGRQSVDTRTNAIESARWLARGEYDSVRLVTTDWHMPRARYELQRLVGDDVEILVDAVPSDPSFGELFAEYNKYLLRRIAVLLGL